ncbi:MAG: hypothetical protein HYX80_07980 [Chloroflexi bacterium]|nr:hypothetical protein [Chloroflexota bacterium]
MARRKLRNAQAATPVLLSSVGCSAKQRGLEQEAEPGGQVVYPKYQREIRLETATGGYGYEKADIVLIDTQKEPALGDIVQFNSDLNNSTGRAMGPSPRLAKIIGLPGDNVSFQQWSYEANGFEVTLGPYYKADGTTWDAQTKDVMWSSERFGNVAGMVLQVPPDEYLCDKRVGEEFSGERDETGSSKIYHRFTVKRAAITGVILKKLGHDKEFEEELKHRVY